MWGVWTAIDAAPDRQMEIAMFSLIVLTISAIKASRNAA
jgi:hypothetical protein